MSSYSKFFMVFFIAVLMSILSLSMGHASDEKQHQPDDQPISQSQVMAIEELSVESDSSTRIYLPIAFSNGFYVPDPCDGDLAPVCLPIHTGGY